MSRQGSQDADDAEGLDRNGGAAAPGDAERQMPRALGEMLFDLAPDEGAVEQHVGAVRRMHRRAVRLQRLFGVDHEGQRLVVDLDLFGGVFGQRAAVGDHGRDPFAGIARLPDRERMALAPWAYRARSSADRSRRQAPRRSARNARPASPAPRTRRSRRCARPDAATAAPRHAACLRARHRRRNGRWPATKRRSSRTRRLVETKRKVAGSALISPPRRIVGLRAGAAYWRRASARRRTAIASTICP